MQERRRTVSSSSSALVVNTDVGHEPSSKSDAPVPTMIFNLVKCIVGAGVLGLPSGVAALGGALLPSTILTFVIGSMSAYGFALIGRVCAYTDSKSYKEAWSKTVGHSTSWLPTVCCLLVTVCSVLAYSMVLADTIPQLLQLFGVSITRNQALFSVTLSVLLPLCLLKSLKSLGPFSLLGIIGMVWTTIAMATRYWDGNYVEGGSLLGSVPPSLQPDFDTTGNPGWFHPNAFVLVSMLSTASMAHYNSPKFYNELKDRTLPRFYTIVASSAFLSCIIFSAVLVLGYKTFGQACSGLILNNYSPQDKLMSVGRITVAVSLICSYPLAFTGVRDGILDLMGVDEANRTNTLLDTVTVALLSFVTLLAMVIRDLRLIFAFGGATWGNFITYLFPVWMLLNYVKKNNIENNKSPVPQKELFVARTVLVSGLVMSVIGARQALQMS